MLPLFITDQINSSKSYFSYNKDYSLCFISHKEFAGIETKKTLFIWTNKEVSLI